MKIFLTGSTGFLGKSIVEYLPQYTYYLYKRGEDVVEELEKFSPDVIIHSAGEIYDELLMYESNIVLTKKIIQWNADRDKKLLYFGSSSEYGKVNSPMTETDDCVPTSFYAMTKLIGTKDCIFASTFFKSDISIIRPFSVYGPNEPERRLIPTLYRNLKANLPISLIEGSHDFIYISDFVKAIDILIHSEKQLGEIYNIGTGVSHTNKEVFQIMVDLIKPDKFDVRYLEDRKKCDSEIWICNNSKIRERLNFNFEYDLDKGLESYIIWKNNQI